MNNNNRFSIYLLAFVVAGLIAAPALAQGGISRFGDANMQDMWGPDADVDRDGSVDILDVQHAINGALGLSADGPMAFRMPVRRYVVASPRASLAVVPEGEAATYTTVGAAHNFPRRPGRIIVRKGMSVVFRLDRSSECVWYEDARGVLGTQIVAEMRPLPTDAEPVDPEEVEENEVVWTEIGRDGARAGKCGPAIGRANIGVRHAFEDVGRYLVRVRVATYAIPAKEPEVDTKAELPPCADVAFNVVFVGVRVVDIPQEGTLSPEDNDWQDVPDPAVRDWGEQIPSEFDDVIENDVRP